ncbi:potassium channel family protein [Paramicrobacterium fandaimingii]|uniref:potassium channel family protein n=1 Tax=Paramicrobacterium fandaimingii TaxID=2708079 RepID=UPI001F41E463|nr:TrkA family potassium uptake protein [Microbacterium fandaimingii]
MVSIKKRRRPHQIPEAGSVAVLGLGRFGQSLGLELMESHVEVLGVDIDGSTVQDLDGMLTHVVRADTTNEEAMRQINVHQFERVVVAIGTDIQASILTASLLLRFGVENIWAKAVSDAHGTILEQLGVKHVVYPERDMGRRVAHLVRGVMQDFLEIGDHFALVKSPPNSAVVGVPLSEANVRSTYGITIAAFKRPGKDWSYTSSDTVIEKDDIILIAGNVRKAEAFSQLE